HNDAWRIAGSTVTDGCHAPAQSVSALSTRLVRVRPLAPQLGVQLPGPGLAQRVLLKISTSQLPSIFSPPRLPRPRLGSRGGEKMRHPQPAIVKASAREEPGLVEDLLGPQQVIHRPTQLGRQDAERLGGAVLFRLPRLPTLGPRAGAQVQARRLAQRPAQVGVADLLV